MMLIIDEAYARKVFENETPDIDFDEARKDKDEFLKNKFDIDTDQVQQKSKKKEGYRNEEKNMFKRRFLYQRMQVVKYQQGM